MKKIYIPQGGGRDFWLRIPMNNESAGRHLCMDDVDENDMHVWLESGYGGCWTLVWEKDGAQRDGIAAKVPASFLGYGTYSVVMAGKFVNGDYFRTKRQLFIRLVDREDQADAEPTMYNEEQAYWAGPAVLSEMLSRDGLNTYELWILQGNEGSLEDYLSVSGLTLNDFMVQWNHLSVEVQTKIQRGEEKGIEVKGDYSATTTYDVNDLVFDPTTNSSYISKHASNTGNALTNTEHWMKTMDGSDVLRAIEDADDATDAANTAAATAESAAAGAVTTITEALTGYFTCGASTSKAASQIKVVDNDHDYIKPSYGGAMKIRMYQVNTYVPTTGNPVKLKIGDETAAELLYNREPVTPDNSWEENEVISVYYDGTYYQASNAQGGGGKAEKIKYDNSQSGLASQNVQGALDELAEEDVVCNDTGFNPTYEAKATATTGNATITTGSHSFTGVLGTNSSANISGITCVSALLKTGKSYKVEFDYSTNFDTSLQFRDANKTNTVVISSLPSGSGSVSTIVEPLADVGMISFFIPANSSGTLTVTNFYIYEVQHVKILLEETIQDTTVNADTNFNPLNERQESRWPGNVVFTGGDHTLTGHVETTATSGNMDGITCFSAPMLAGHTYKIEFDYTIAFKTQLQLRDSGSNLLVAGRLEPNGSTFSSVVIPSFNVAQFLFYIPANTPVDGEGENSIVLTDIHIYEVSAANEAIKDISDYTEVWREYEHFLWGSGFVTANNWYGVNGTTHNHKRITVTKGMERIKVTANSEYSSFISFFKKYTTLSLDPCTGYATRFEVPSGKTNEFAIPSDCGCIIIDCMGGQDDYEPDNILIKYNSESAIDGLYEEMSRQVDISYFEAKTIVPSPSNTYNAFFTNNQPHNFVESNADILYFPEVFVKGGQTISLTYTSQINVIQLPYIPLGTSAVNCIENADIVKVNVFLAETETTKTIILEEDTKRIAFVVAGSIDGNKEHIANYITSLTLPVVKDPVLFDIPSFVNRKTSVFRDYERILRQAVFTNNATPALGLLHFTDPHSDIQSFDDIVEVRRILNKYINDILCTGDVVYNCWNSTTTTDSSVGDAATHGYRPWVESEAARQSLYVLGNHDCATNTATEYDQLEGLAWNGKGKDWAYTTYFAPFAEALGVVQPNGVDDTTSPNYHACYWHKDYAAQKVRLIGLDCMNHYDGLLDENNQPIAGSWVKHGTTEQEDWLRARLADTLDSTNEAYGFSVVICCHYPLNAFNGNLNEVWNETTHKFDYNHSENGGYLMNHKTQYPTVFNNFPIRDGVAYSAEKRLNLNNRVANPSSQYGYDKGNKNHIGDIIKDFMDNEGKFVAWICGHTHIDSIVFCPEYPDILNVVADNTGYTKPHGESVRSSYPEHANSNIYVIDTANGLFKIVRVGVNINRYFDEKNILCYDYVNRVIRNEG